MPKRTTPPRWRPMKTAPRDGTHILLAYPSFSDNGEVYVGMGRWVDCPHDNVVSHELEIAFRDLRPITLPESPYEPHWEVAYVAVMEHSAQGGRWRGHGYTARSVTIRHPFGWMPLPETTKAMARKVRTGSYLL